MPSTIQIKRSTNLAANPVVKFGELAVKSSNGSVVLVVGDNNQTPVEIGGTNFAQLNSIPLTQNIQQVLLKYINLY